MKTKTHFDYKKLKKYLNENIDIVLEKMNIECDTRSKIISCKCPAHDGDNNNSFVYYKNTNKWICWTSKCQEDYGDDVLGLIKGFLSKQEGQKASFKNVLKWVKDNLGINISSFKDGVKKAEPPKEIDILDLFNYTNVKNPDIIEEDKSRNNSNIPSDYFVKKRLYNPTTMKEFNIGDSTEKVGISKLRSIIPIHNDNGNIVVGNIYRAINSWMSPKFLVDKNFKKTEYLYNFHRAKDYAISNSSLFIVEGTGDVWRLWEAGVKNSVALFGKELSTTQINKIDKLSVTNLIILIDNDEAGRESKVKIKRDLSRYFNLIFPSIPYTYKDVGKMSPKKLQDTILKDLKGFY
jgi:5S rRNA maturation endonuclease (ribonuclease M5)/N6-adenosine-specific RNA methylase IME4